MKETKIRIAIVDDHQIVIDGIQALLTPYSNFEVVVSTTSSIQVLSLLQHTAVDVLLTDIMMPEMDGQVLAKKVREQFASIKIIALSMSGQGNVVSEMINDADINGYVLKNIGKVELATAINKVASGGIYFSDEVLKELQHYTAIKKENMVVNITTRELEIIQLIAKDFSNKKIADHLFISERTVETHRKNIFRKTNTNTVIGLLKYATDHRLL
jgi:two-component system, NarL family, nitrate/nitrite response regulator NarL